MEAFLKVEKKVAAGADIVDGSSTNSSRWKHKCLGLVVPVKQRASQVALTKVGMAVQLRSRDERGGKIEEPRYLARVVARMKVDKAQGRDRKKQERDATKGAIKAKKNQAAERTASTRAVTSDDAVRAEVTAVSTPKVPQTATGFMMQQLCLARKVQPKKAESFLRKFGRRRSKPASRRGFRSSEILLGPSRTKQSCSSLMALEIERLNPERTIPRDDRSIVAVSAEGLEVSSNHSVAENARLSSAFLGSMGNEGLSLSAAGPGLQRLRHRTPQHQKGLPSPRRYQKHGTPRKAKARQGLKETAPCRTTRGFPQCGATEKAQQQKAGGAKNNGKKKRTTDKGTPSPSRLFHHTAPQKKRSTSTTPGAQAPGYVACRFRVP